jgi:hypothetical protein
MFLSQEDLDMKSAVAKRSIVVGGHKTSEQEESFDALLLRFNSLTAMEVT